MDLPAPTPPAAAPEHPAHAVPNASPPVTAPSYQNYPPPPETVTYTESATDGSVNGPLPFSTESDAHGPEADAGHPDEHETGDDEFYGYDQAYAPEHAPPPPDRTGRLFKIAARLLFAVAILGGIAWGAFWLIRQYRAGNGNNAAGKTNPPRANLPPPVFTPTPANSNSPSANVNSAPNANISPSPSVNANNANTAPPTPSPTPASTPTPKATPPPPADAGSGNFAIQVGSHPDASSANQQVAQLQAKGLSARAVQAVIPGRGTWYRVRIGHFASRDEASRYGAGLRSKGVADFYITDDGK